MCITAKVVLGRGEKKEGERVGEVRKRKEREGRKRDKEKAGGREDEGRRERRS